jgi:membrane-associated phospholipid phosphatase
MPTFLFSIIYFFTPFLLAPYNNFNFLVMIFLATFFIPLVAVSALYMTGTIKSFVMNEATERAIPFTFTSIFYWIMSYLFFNQFKESLTIIVIMMSISTTISLVSIISFFWKISAHAAGICGIIGFMFVITLKYPEVQLTYPLALMIILSGIIMSIRLYLQVHNIKEVLVGGLLAFLLNFSLFFFLT